MQTVVLLAVIAVLMLGLGIGLTVEDFRRVRRYRATIGVALVAQLVLLPLGCLGIVLALRLPPLSAAGLMIVSAAPGGPLAGVYSRIFGGDVAFNLTLTAVNSVLSVFTLTFITNLSLAHFLPGERNIGLHGVEIVQVFAAVLVPIGLGMLLRARRPALAVRAEPAFRVVSGVLLAVLVVGGIAANLTVLADNVATVLPAVLVFAALSLTTGYVAGRVSRADEPVAIAAGFEVGFHNAAVALGIALAVSTDLELAAPASIYGLSIMLLAAGYGFTLRRLVRRRPTVAMRGAP